MSCDPTIVAVNLSSGIHFCGVISTEEWKTNFEIALLLTAPPVVLHSMCHLCIFQISIIEAIDSVSSFFVTESWMRTSCTEMQYT